jgi:hypothetical protein
MGNATTTAVAARMQGAKDNGVKARIQSDRETGGERDGERDRDTQRERESRRTGSAQEAEACECHMEEAGRDALITTRAPQALAPRSSHCTLDATKTISDVLGSTPEMHVICPSIYSVPAFRLMRPSPLPTA